MTRTAVKITTRAQALELLGRYDNFLFDCDGVLWLDTAAIPGVPGFVGRLQRQGKKLAFVTNNSSKSRHSYVGKFAALGMRGIAKEAVYPTCYSAALTLQRDFHLEPGAKVWVFGDAGLEEELHEAGFCPVGGNDPRLDAEWDPAAPVLEVDPAVRAVVVGSTKKLNYMRFAATVQYVLAHNKTLPFIGTNIDRTYPGPGGMVLPAGGASVFLMQYTCDRPFVDVGKPSQVFLDNILAVQGFARDRTLMVGDTLYTDIKFGNDGGLATLLVLSGGTKEADLERIADASLVPVYYVESLGHLHALLEQDT